MKVAIIGSGNIGTTIAKNISLDDVIIVDNSNEVIKEPMEYKLHAVSEIEYEYRQPVIGKGRFKQKGYQENKIGKRRTKNKQAAKSRRNNRKK